MRREGEVEIGRERELKENTERWNNRSKTDVEDNEVRGKGEENDVEDKKIKGRENEIEEEGEEKRK